MIGFIRKSDLARDRGDQRPDRFAVGEKVDAKITTLDKKNRKVSLSIKAREIDEEKQAMADYGSSDSGASLGDILGAAFSKAAKEREADEGGSAAAAATESAAAEDSAPAEAEEAADDQAESEAASGDEEPKKD